MIISLKKTPQGTDSVTVEFKIDSDDLDEIVQEFEFFLRGCGFAFSSVVLKKEDDVIE